MILRHVYMVHYVAVVLHYVAMASWHGDIAIT